MPKRRVTQGTSKSAAAARYARFVEAYIANEGNATQAAKTAGYSAKTATSQGERLLRRDDVAALIEKRRAETLAIARAKTQLTADEIMDSLARDIRFDPARAFRKGKLIPWDQMDEDTRRAIRGLSFDAKGRPSIKFPEQTSAREQGMKHFGLYEADNKQSQLLGGIQIFVEGVKPSR